MGMLANASRFVGRDEHIGLGIIKQQEGTCVVRRILW
jgi:hypothetical protein